MGRDEHGYLLAGKDEFLGPYTSGQEKFDQLVASLSETVSDNPAQVKLLGEVKATIDQWMGKVIIPAIAPHRIMPDKFSSKRLFSMEYSKGRSGANSRQRFSMKLSTRDTGASANLM